MINLYQGDCLSVLKTFPDNSVEAVVTDPPYGLAFMGKKWDYDVPSVEVWREVLRVLKPGGYLLSFGGTRTYHRMVVNIEDAGFEIRDQIQWLYGSGFPKSHNISKGIDKQLGAEPTIIGKIASPASTKRIGTMGRPEHSGSGWNEEPDLTAPTSDAAKKWAGWGTALKPANEPIVLARKPLSEKTVAENVLKWGTGGLNIDASRIEGLSDKELNWTPQRQHAKTNIDVGGARPGQEMAMFNPKGRFPANIILDETAAEMLDEQSGRTTSNVSVVRGAKRTQPFGMKRQEVPGFGDTGGASRFFYVAKASKSERNKGMEGSEEVETKRANHHPTVKPVKLMEYLIKLIAPPGGVVLDPFMGSGTTGIACKNVGIEFVGIEREPEYFEIAKKRTT